MIFPYSFFQTTPSCNIERFQIKLSAKAKEAFGQVAQTAQNRLEGDQMKVWLFHFRFPPSFAFLFVIRLKMLNVEQN